MSTLIFPRFSCLRPVWVVALYLCDLDVEHSAGGGDGGGEGEGQGGSVAGVGANVHVHCVVFYYHNSKKTGSLQKKKCHCVGPYFRRRSLVVFDRFAPAWKTSAVNYWILHSRFDGSTVTVNVSRQSPSLSLALPPVPAMVKRSKSSRSIQTSNNFLIIHIF